jgi:hypothetical protein
MQGTYVCCVKSYKCCTEKWYSSLFQGMTSPLGHSSKTEIFTEEHVYHEGSRPNLHQAAKDGNWHLVETLIDSREEINSVNAGGCTGLFYAALKGKRHSSNCW